MEKTHRPNIAGGVEISACAALGLLLGMFRIYRMPQGGSITLETVPILFLAVHRGVRAGLSGGAILGVLKLILQPYIVHPAQVVLDYPLALSLLGLAGVVRRPALLGIWIGGLARGTAHLLSGAIFFAAYAPEGMNPWAYSAMYNASYVVPEAIIASLIVPILIRRIKGGG